MTDIPMAGFLCSGKTPLALSVSVHCAYKMMDVLKENGFGIGACHTEITEPVTLGLIERATATLEHITGCCELVVTVGCDGFSVCDIMPDITEALCKKSATFFSSVLCGARELYSNEPKSIVRAPSRATAGIAGHSLVLNFPSDIRVSETILKEIMPAVWFTVYNLSGKSASNFCEFKKFFNSSLEFNEVFKKEYIVNR